MGPFEVALRFTSRGSVKSCATLKATLQHGGGVERLHVLAFHHVFPVVHFLWKFSSNHFIYNEAEASYWWTSNLMLHLWCAAQRWKMGLTKDKYHSNSTRRHTFPRLPIVACSNCKRDNNRQTTARLCPRSLISVLWFNINRVTKSRQNFWH